jgi:signal transduction histidine kinase
VACTCVGRSGRDSNWRATRALPPGGRHGGKGTAGTPRHVSTWPSSSPAASAERHRRHARPIGPGFPTSATVGAALGGGRADPAGRAGSRRDRGVLDRAGPLRGTTTAALLGAFADQAATAIESARLYGQARELALLQERDRIAKELHDGIIQTIYAVGLNVDYCRWPCGRRRTRSRRGSGDAAAGAEPGDRDIRNYILDLTHRVGSELSLQDAAEEGWRASTGGARRPAPGRSRSGGRCPMPPRRRCRSERAEVVQVLREALANAAATLEATEVGVAARLERGRLALTMRDDGVGVRARQARENGHLGLRNMANRARGLGGHLHVESRPARGRSVELVVPPDGREARIGAS